MPGPLREFAVDLRELRAGTGLTYRALARKAGYSASALSAAASGDALPTHGVLLAYVGACGGDSGTWEQRWDDLAAELRRTHPGLLSGPALPPEQAEPGDGESARPVAQRAAQTAARLDAQPPPEAGQGELSALWPPDGLAPLAGAWPPDGVAPLGGAAAVAALASLPPRAAPAPGEGRHKTRRAVHRIPFGPAPVILAGAILISYAILSNGGSPQLSTAPPHTTAPTISIPAPHATGDKTPSSVTRTPGTGAANGVRATAPQSRIPAVPAAPAQMVRYSFEQGPETWGPFWNGGHLQATVTSQLAYDGSGALLLQATPGSQPPAIGTTHIDGLSAGRTVTMRLHYAGQGQGQVSPFIQDTSYGIHWMPNVVTFPSGPGWVTLSFTIPDFAPLGIGIQLDAHGPTDLLVALDAVTW